MTELEYRAEAFEQLLKIGKGEAGEVERARVDALTAIVMYTVPQVPAST